MFDNNIIRKIYNKKNKLLKTENYKNLVLSNGLNILVESLITKNGLTKIQFGDNNQKPNILDVGIVGNVLGEVFDLEKSATFENDLLNINYKFTNNSDNKITINENVLFNNNSIAFSRWITKTILEPGDYFVDKYVINVDITQSYSTDFNFTNKTNLIISKNLLFGKFYDLNYYGNSEFDYEQNNLINNLFSIKQFDSIVRKNNVLNFKFNYLKNNKNVLESELLAKINYKPLIVNDNFLGKSFSNQPNSYYCFDGKTSTNVTLIPLKGYAGFIFKEKQYIGDLLIQTLNNKGLLLECSNDTTNGVDGIWKSIDNYFEKEFVAKVFDCFKAFRFKNTSKDNINIVSIEFQIFCLFAKHKDNKVLSENIKETKELTIL